VIPIKKISGDLLLLLYTLQRKVQIFDFTILQFEFSGTQLLGDGHSIRLEDNSGLAHSLLEVTNGCHEDAYNALQYLHEKGFITFREEPVGSGTNLINELRVSAGGIDIIEGIERGEKEKKAFTITFNIKVDNTFNVESLIKAELDSIFKGSLF
jgi:hypothetical protein